MHIAQVLLKSFNVEKFQYILVVLPQASMLQKVELYDHLNA